MSYADNTSAARWLLYVETGPGLQTESIEKNREMPDCCQLYLTVFECPGNRTPCCLKHRDVKLIRVIDREAFDSARR